MSYTAVGVVLENPMVCPAGPSIWGVFRNLKWFSAPVLPLAIWWHSTHWRLAVELRWRAWRPE